MRRVFNERFGGVPVRDERLWGMLRPCRKKAWSSALGAAGSGEDGRVGAGAAAATSLRGGGGSVSSSGKALGPRGSLLGSEWRGSNGGSVGVASALG